MEQRGQKKERVGVVISDKANKTRTIAVERLIPHPLYKKVLRRTKKYYAHDEGNVSHEGDLVRIRESRPLSKTKRWRLIEVVKVAD
ncbi:MAG: 30S ribosomal protein S17 [Candidatus Hydrogenedentota bacterium]|nr:MAG: 30S ribosomal protein S17 [Candidatus Hydrogenedentota bacterium]